jgi:twitching motility protein PilT
MQPTDPITPAQPTGMPIDGVSGVVSSLPPSTQPATVPTTSPEVGANDQVHQVEATTHTGKLSVEPYLEEVIRRDASDVHIQVGLPPMLRVDGALAPIRGEKVLTAEDIDDIVFSLLDDEQKEIYLKDKEIDFSFAYGDLGRFRVNSFHEKGNPAAAFRLIPNKIRTVEDLGLPPIMNKLTEYPRGLVLVTGPTGSGKSTTLAAMLDKVNRERAVHIITIEDPIEYQHHHKKSIVVQREVHFDTKSFSSALRSSLREDPDVVLIGEMRDLETISTAITVAETGHLVFATLHTNSAAQSIDRMVDVFPPHQQQQIRIQLASVLQGIVAQRLVPMIGGGRSAVAEILVVTPAVRNIIREGKTHQLDAVIQTGAEYGMQSMDATLAHYIHEGKISYEEAKSYAVNLEELDRMMRH